MTKSAKEKVNHYIDQCSKRLIHIKVKNGSMIDMLLLLYVIAKRHVMLYRFVVNWVRS